MKITQELYKARYTAKFPQSDVREAVEKSLASRFSLQVLFRNQAFYYFPFTKEQGPDRALEACLESASIVRAYSRRSYTIALFAIW